MPPSHHSHSSHSSHHSSHSSHSHSSHSSRSSYSSYHSYSSYTPKFRVRTNQPRGWSASLYGKTITYRCKSHDYVYYPHGWTSEDGVTYQAGYYDENGIYYTNVAATNMETVLTCKYCGTKQTCQWVDGITPNCPNCGSAYEIDKIDIKQEDIPVREKDYSSDFTKIFNIFMLIVAILTFSPFLAGLITIFINSANHSISTLKQNSNLPKDVYVYEIGRACVLDGEDYYDAQTQSWFWWNNEIDPPQWQYWFEGISSQYGEYGWMEYDDEEKQWYIEVKEDKWKKYNPTSEDKKRLWHFTNAYSNELY